MTLVTSIPPGASEVRLRVDRSAVERILFDLVDNACKYARAASDRRIHLEAESDDRVVRGRPDGAAFCLRLPRA